MSSPKTVVDLTPNWDRPFRFDGETQFDVSPDGKWLALCAGTTPPPFQGATRTPTFIFPPSIIPPPHGKISQATTPAPTTTHASVLTLLFGRGVRPNGLAEFTKLMRVDPSSGKIDRLLTDVDLLPQDWHFSPDGKTLFFRAEDRARTKIFSVNADGTGLKTLVSDDTNSNLAVGAKQLFFLKQSFIRADEVYAYDLGAGASAVQRISTTRCSLD